MKHLCALFIAANGDNPTPMAISPNDDLWFVGNDDAPPDFREFVSQVEKAGSLVCIGHLVAGDTFTWPPSPQQSPEASATITPETSAMTPTSNGGGKPG